MALRKISRGLNKPCILLIVIAGIERLAFKGVASNLVTYLTDVMKMSNSSAAKFVNNWVGFTWIMPLAVASLADSYWDRYATVLGFSLLYASGLMALTLTSTTSTNKSSISSLTLSLYMISLGQGGYNPSLQAFAADQIPEDEEHELPITDDQSSSKKKSLFFQWWYFGVCSGSLLGVSVMSFIQDNLGWGLGFAVPTLSMLVSIAMFLFGNRFYTLDGKRSLENVVRAIKERFLKMIKGFPLVTRGDEDSDDVAESELEEKPLCISCEEDVVVDDQQNTTRRFSQNQLEEHVNPLKAMKLLLSLLPIWIMLLLFAVIFQQPATFFTKQGMTMKRNIGQSGFKIPPAALQSAITISIVALMPWYDAVFVPFARFLTRNEKGVTVMQRIAIGMFLSVIAMAVAAVIEEKRLKMTCHEREDVPLSIFWLLPQYVLLGVSDIFTVVGMQEFFYSEVPASMRTMGIALYSSVFGVGSFLSAVLISLIEFFTSRKGDENGGWFSDDMSKARLDRYYWFLAMSSAVSLLAFLVFCKCFRQ